MTSLISLITCSRDPDDEAFTATLSSVSALRVPAGWSVEHLLVDNGSVESIANRPLVRRYLAAHSWASLTRDDTEGLAFVRAHAIRASRGELVLTVDDDNVLDPGYLEALVAAAVSMPEVGVFGAGHIEVILPGDAPEWASDPWVRQLFQERSFPAPVVAASLAWQAHYPPGTGMAVRRAVAMAFADAVERGEIRNVSRTGERLGGGEDAQIVWFCVRSGFLVGAFPSMRLRHVISSLRLTPAYVARLVFGIHESAPPARHEVFTDEHLPPLVPLRAIYRALRGIPRGLHPVVRNARLATALGDAAALCLMHKRPEPWWLRALITRTGVR